MDLCSILFFLVQIFNLVESKSSEDLSRERRLLVDPNDRFLQIEKLLNELNAKVATLESDNRQLKANDHTMQTELQTANANLEILKNENQHLKSNGGAVFIRWGRKDCPTINGTQILYSGIAGGGGFDETGSGTTNLCLPHNPDQAKTGFPQSTFAGFVAHVYGAEYQYSYGIVQTDDDVPCAVCIDTTARSSVMIPAKSSCLTGWTKQYTGNLCANHFNHHGASEYSCIDQDPQYFEGRRQDLNGRLFYPAVTVCGSLPCPPYENAKYLPCVVCTK